MTDDDLETALRSLGPRLDVPDPPDVTATVLARLDEPVRWSTPRRVVAAAVAVLVALATAMAVSPAVRAAAVYDLLRIGGVEIHENEPAPVTPPVDPPLPDERDVSLDQAREAVGFPLKLPAELGEPIAVRLTDNAEVVSMAFGSPHGAIRIDQFDGGLNPMFEKFAPVFYTDHDGQMQEKSARLAGSTLIWERGGITYRVEGELTRQQAIAVAESLR
jgi:hypothetical protein